MAEHSKLRRQLRYFKPHTGALIIVSIALLLEMGFSSAVPFCFSILIDRALIGGETSVLWWILGGLGIGAVIVAGVGLWRDYLYAKVCSHFLSALRTEMFAHLQNLSMNFYTKHQLGDILSRFSGDLATVENAVGAVIPWAILPGLEVIANSVLLFVLDWRLALMSLLVWPVTLLGPRIFAPKVSAESYIRREREGGALAVVQENIGAQPVVKIFGLRDEATKQFQKASADLTGTMLRVGFFGALVERSATTGAMLLQVAILGVGAVMVMHESLTVGTLAAFQALFLSLSFSMGYVTQYIPTLMQAGSGVQRIEEVLFEEPQVRDTAGSRDVPPIQRGITFDDVSFSYTGEEMNLKHANLDIPHATSVAFVGGSGSGKSTLLSLLIRFYDPVDGSVKMDGVDLREITLASLHKQMSVVFQESFLFNTTIRENIRLGKLDATDDEIIAAAKLAEIHDVIMAMLNGYDTIVGERGGKLSGGQRQRIAIARAMVRDPKILMLDEATSALDPRTEAAVNETIERISKGRTIVSVTHRLTSVMNYDKIVVLDKGVIMEEGSHNELLRQNASYSKLWAKQSGFQVSADGDQVDVTVDRLRAIPIFANIDEALLTDMVRHFVTEQVPAERLVVQEGDAGDLLYIIVRGSVEVLKNGPDGTPRRVAVLEDGDHFGEVALLQPVPRTATVRTLDPSVFLTLKRNHFANLLERTPQMREELEKIFLQRLSDEQKTMAQES